MECDGKSEQYKIIMMTDQKKCDHQTRDHHYHETRNQGNKDKKKMYKALRVIHNVCDAQWSTMKKKGKLYKTYPDRHPRQPNLFVRCIHQIEKASTVTPYKRLEP